MIAVKEKHVIGDRRSVMQQARLAVRDIYDVIIELFTNADDRYQRLGVEGTIEIEIDRGRGKTTREVRVRDFADGMTLKVMDEKLSRTGARVSGMEEGYSVRGTNSRGAKDIAALGTVTFESIATEDGQLHSCEITDSFVFKPKGTVAVTPKLRSQIGINQGSGTLVTIKLGRNHTIHQSDNLIDRMQRLVALRDILSDQRRKIILRDSARKKSVVLTAPVFEGKERVKETFTIPGYPEATAKLIISRSGSPFQREPNRFRLGGILVKSRRAIHESTYFDPDLETNPHALWFYGRLVCPYIDELWNDFDNRFEAGLEPEASNPVPIIDPSRQTGLTREHPFVQALFREAIRRLRPLVEEERQREEKQRAEIESEATRKRLNALEKAAVKFMKDFGEDEEASRDPDRSQSGSRFKVQGYGLNPPFVQMIEGHTQRFWLTVSQESFPELEVGASVQIECLTGDVTSDKKVVGLQPHPTQEGVLRAVWNVKALSATPATGIRVRVGPIATESVIEIFRTEADKYRDVTELSFGKKRYRLYTDGTRKKVRVLAPLREISAPEVLDVFLSNRHFSLSGSREIRPYERLGVAIAEFYVQSDGTEAKGVLTVRRNGREVSAAVESVLSPGAGLKIQLEDIDLKNQRYRWRQNVLEIAARHPSLARYLGPKSEGFPGQESKHFRVLVAEIVADAVCAKLVAQNIQANPEDYEGADWDQYYADYSRYMAGFLPTAHKLQCPEGD